MGKKFSTSLIVIGVVLVAVAIVWWAVIAPLLVKLPSDVDTQMKFEGTLTVYLDPTTGAAIPEDQAMVIPVTADRSFVSVPDLYTSDVAVFEDTLVLNVAGEAGQPQVSRYAMDRKTRKCVDSPENWAYSPQITLDRTGSYGALFPGGLSVGDTVTVFFNDPSKTFDVKVEESIADWNGLGITALKIDGTRASADYNPAIAQAVLVSGQGLPTEISFDQLAAQMKAQGLDLQALLGALATVATPEDLAALMALTQQPVQLVYNQHSADIYYIEQKTGATVGATFDRTTTMTVDTSGLMGAFAILTNYASDPTVGPAIQAAMGAATQLAGAEPNKVFNQTMSIVKDGAGSEATLAQSAKDKLPLIGLVNLWIPLIIVIVGGLILILGAAGLALKSKASA